MNVPSKQRFLTVSVMIIAQCLAFKTADHWPGDLGALWGLFTCIWLAHATSLLWLEDSAIWHEEEMDYLVRNGKVNRYIPVVNWYRPLRLWNNARLLGTPRQLARIHKSTDSRSLLKFTLQRLWKLFAYWAIHRVMSAYIFPGPFKPFHVDEFSPSRETIFRRFLQASDTDFTLREVLLRAGFVLYWGYTTVSALNGIHAALSLLAVSVLGFDDPRDWPPLFGSLGDAWTIRDFWGKFWHQIVVRSYKNHGQYFSRAVLGLKPGSAADKITVIFSIFLLSGITHAAVARQLGDRCGWSRDIWWFCMNFLAGALEAVIVQMARAVADKHEQRSRFDRLASSSWINLPGFVWVFCFFFWSVPKWQYPKLFCHIQDLEAHRKGGK